MKIFGKKLKPEIEEEIIMNLYCLVMTIMVIGSGIIALLIAR